MPNDAEARGRRGATPGRRSSLRTTPCPAATASSLAERIREAGYTTAAFTEDALLRGASGFWNGFDTDFEDEQVKRGAAGDPSGDGLSLTPLLDRSDAPGLRNRVVWATSGNSVLPKLEFAVAARRGELKCIRNEVWA